MRKTYVAGGDGNLEPAKRSRSAAETLKRVPSYCVWERLSNERRGIVFIELIGLSSLADTAVVMLNTPSFRLYCNVGVETLNLALSLSTFVSYRAYEVLLPYQQPRRSWIVEFVNDGNRVSPRQARSRIKRFRNKSHVIGPTRSSYTKHNAASTCRRVLCHTLLLGSIRRL